MVEQLLRESSGKTAGRGSGEHRGKASIRWRLKCSKSRARWLNGKDGERGGKEGSLGGGHFSKGIQEGYGCSACGPGTQISAHVSPPAP